MIEVSKNWLPVSIVILSWFALITQFYLIIINRTVPVTETIIRYFSFFTILTNFIVAIAFTFFLSERKSQWKVFFSKKSIQTSITVYILIVGIVYNVILRFLWQPKGLQFITDELLHTVVPLLCFIFWWKYVSSKRLQWRNAFPWLGYPLLYIFYTLIHGAISGFYPYPFINVTEIGYEKVIINSALLAFGFLIISWLLIGISKKKKETNKY